MAPLLPEQRRVAFGMKSHDEGVCNAKSRCAQCSTSTENDLCQLLVTDAIGQGELKQFLTLGDPDSLGLTGKLQGLVPVDLDLVGDDELRLLDVLGSQELLGTGA